MGYKIIINDKADYEWLVGLMARSKEKMKENPSVLSEMAAHVLNVSDALEAAERVNTSSEKKKPKIVDEYIPNLCKDHPKNKAERPPRTDCKGCWEAYKRLNPLKYDVARRTYLRNVRKRNEA